MSRILAIGTAGAKASPKKNGTRNAIREFEGTDHSSAGHRCSGHELPDRYPRRRAIERCDVRIRHETERLGDQAREVGERCSGYVVAEGRDAEKESDHRLVELKIVDGRARAQERSYSEAQHVPPIRRTVSRRLGEASDGDGEANHT